MSTTRITVRRPDPAVEAIQDPDGDGYGTPSDVADVYTVAHAGVRAVIVPTSGTKGAPGDTEFTAYSLACDPIDLGHNDLIDDEVTGDTFFVEWAHTTPGVAGLGHTTAGLSTIDGPGGAA